MSCLYKVHRGLRQVLKMGPFKAAIMDQCTEKGDEIVRKDIVEESVKIVKSFLLEV